METFWNNGERETIKGLDIMGLRQLDQSIEQDLVGSITTISFRARYMSLLSWLFVEFYTSQLSSQGGEAAFDYEKFKQVSARMELVVLAATTMGKNWGESGNIYGLIGSQLFEDEIKLLMQHGSIAVDTMVRGGASYGTYVMPCRGFGLLSTSTNNPSIPVEIKPRGKKLYEARKKVLAPSCLTKLILEGGTLTTELIEQEGRHFSMNGVAENPEELKLLREALLEPYIEHSSVQKSYDHFTDTARMAMTILGGSATALSSDEVLKINYRNTISSSDLAPSAVEIAWAEYELRRRVHFALELLLGAMTQTLTDDLVEGTVEQVLAQWDAMWDRPTLLADLISEAGSPFMTQLTNISEQVPGDAFLAKGPNRGGARNMSPSPQALYALSLLISCRAQTEKLRAEGIIPDRKHYLERAFSLLDDQEKTVSASLRELLIGVVIEPHLKTSLRKLGQGQKCSLRFFPEGNLLRPTGTRVAAGYSGDRLGNFLGFFADLGYLERVDNARFSLATAGSDLLSSWRGEA